MPDCKEMWSDIPVVKPAEAAFKKIHIPALYMEIDFTERLTGKFKAIIESFIERSKVR